MQNMKTLRTPLSCTVALLILISHAAHAGDDASGRTPISVDLELPFTSYSMTPKDALWSESLVKRLKYTGRVVHFVRTSLPLRVNGRTVEGVVYQAVEKPDFFYIANADAMLKIGSRWAYSPEVSGFSIHAPRSGNFIVCLNLGGGVPFLSSSPVRKGIVTWKGDFDRRRLQ